MEEIIKSGGISGLLAAVVVMLGLHLVAKVGEFLWHLKKQKDTVTEKGIKHLSDAVDHNTKVTEKLGSRLEKLEHTLSDVTKFKTDLRRLYAAVKLLSGERWPTVRSHILEDETGLS